MAATVLQGGAALEAKLQELAAKVSKPGTLRVGFLEGATYSDGTSVAMVAAIQEFGAPAKGIPPRPFFRSMITKGSPQWGAQLGAVMLAADYNVELSLGRMGEVLKGDLQDSITDLTTPALSPVTLMLRKMRADNPDLQVNASTVVAARARVSAGESASGVSTKPLVDTGHLLQSVGYEVNT